MAEEAHPPPRKVRSACRRCRQKRIKCDGSIPACGNCARVKVPCVDVHGGNNHLSIPRDFAIKCGARIRWLEHTLRSLQPDFDLSQGPQVNLESIEPTSSSQELSTTAESTSREDELANKRSHSAMEESDVGSPLSVKARSVAIDLATVLTLSSLVGLICQQEIPSPEEASILLGVYFQHIHTDQPFLHPASLVNAYKALYTCSEHGYDETANLNGWINSVSPFSYNGKIDVAFGEPISPISISTAVFHVFMAFSLAATVLTRKKNYDHSPSKFYRMAMSTSSESFSHISVHSLQALLLLVVQSLIEPAGVDVWTLSHVAMAHCIDMGLQREPGGPSAESPAVEATIRRFIFYTVYSLDRSIATIQGRPLGIRDETFDIRPPDESHLLDMITIPNNELSIRLAPPQHLILSICRFKLDRHVSEIKLLLYHLPNLPTETRTFVWPTNIPEIQYQIKSDLDSWLADVSNISASCDMEEEEKLMLHCEKLRLEQLYHNTVALLFQPSQMFPSPNQDALLLCYHSCSRRLQVYDTLSNQELLLYNWRNIHGIFSSGATIVYCIWASRQLQNTIPFEKILRDLRTCSNHLSIGSQWWPSVRAGKESFEKMIDLMIKFLSHTQESAPPPSLPPATRRRRNGHSNIGQDRTPDPEALRIEPGTEHPIQPLDGSQTAFDDMEFSPAAFDSINAFDSDVPSIEAAIETFMADYLHDDWGWDPFSGSIGISDNYRPPL
ncbi:uncharacterized protein N7506_004908 [Penicillium brevicompactum]|uniref:uncharacterized protein n=1 Tax=Penicillium brevicompactum TaxID=5074 RepID=UPI00254076F0|nr:uncharacterized protein N7506_004908 [Penicillium brevicompactum]KAJ5336886.1 hypothetical protein N7506_004908 [Penicillium brevicompactum]